MRSLLTSPTGAGICRAVTRAVCPTLTIVEPGSHPPKISISFHLVIWSRMLQTWRYSRLKCPKNAASFIMSPAPCAGETRVRVPFCAATDDLLRMTRARSPYEYCDLPSDLNQSCLNPPIRTLAAWLCAMLEIKPNHERFTIHARFESGAVAGDSIFRYYKRIRNFLRMSVRRAKISASKLIETECLRHRI